MKILVLCIGKTKEKYLRKGIEEYLSRIQHYMKSDFREWSASKAKGSQHQIMEEEAKWVRDQMHDGDLLLLLDERGKQYSSKDFARKIEHWLMHTRGRIVFVIGGPYGFTEELKAEAKGIISLSKMTFSHQMIRIFILEQIYRAFTILKGESYHNE